MLCLVLTPPHAKILADKGWTKKEIQAFITDQGRVPAYHVPEYWRVREGGFSGLHKNWIPMNLSDSCFCSARKRLDQGDRGGGKGGHRRSICGPPGGKLPGRRHLDHPQSRFAAPLGKPGGEIPGPGP